MEWYEHGVAAAIKEAFSQSKIFLVYLEGDNEDSKYMGKTWDDEEVQRCVKESCVSVKVHSDRDDGKQFAAFYPVLLVPATYLINSSGVPVDIIPGFVEPVKFVERLKDTFQKIETGNTNTSEKQPEDNRTSEDTDVSSVEDKAREKTQLDNSSVSELTPVQPPDQPQSASTTVGEDSLSVPADQNTVQSLEERRKRAEQLIQATREKRLKEEEQKEKEKEFKRRREGQELTKAQRSQAERQATDLAAEIAKKKAEERAAREAVREQIRRDRAEKSAKFSAEEAARAKQNQEKKEKKEGTTVQSPSQESSTCQIQFRYPDGANRIRTFEPDACLTYVAEEAAKESQGKYTQVRLASIYPKREFTNEELSKTVRELGLMPRAALIVLPGSGNSNQKVTNTGTSIVDIFWMVLAPILWLLSLLKAMFSGDNDNDTKNQQTPVTTKPAHEPRRTQSSSSASRDTPEFKAYRRHGNIHKFRQEDESEDDDDENKTWNGNSTQQL